MEEDVEKALNNLWNSLDDEFFNLTYSQEQMKEDIRLILNRYNYLDSKAENLINKNKELEEKLEELKKIMEAMLDAMTEREFDIMCEDCGNYYCEWDAETFSGCLLDYFRKKAKGE